MDRAVGGSPAPTGPSRLGAVRQCGVAIANLFRVNRPVYATPAENIRAAQAAADELDNFEGEERHLMRSASSDSLTRLPSRTRPAATLMRRNGKTTTRLLAETKARCLGCRLAVSAEEKIRSRLPAAVSLASPSSATKTAAQEQCNDGTTVRLLPLAGKGESPRRLLISRHSATALAAEKESERMTLATGLTDSTDPWRWRRKTSWVRRVSAPAFETSPFPKGSHSQETRPSTPAP